MAKLGERVLECICSCVCSLARCTHASHNRGSHQEKVKWETPRGIMQVDGAYDFGLQDLLYLGPSGIFEKRILDRVSAILL